MPGPLSKRMKGPTAITRRVARVVFSTIKKIGSSRGVTLKKIHDFIKEEYPNSNANIIRLNNTLEKALAFGAVSKKFGNRYVLGSVIRSLQNPVHARLGITQARRRGRRRGRKGRRRSKRDLTSTCAEFCDKWICWPVTLAGHNATMPCPKVRGTVENGLAYKYCTFSGTWEVKKNAEGVSSNYTHYETCIMPQIQQLSDMCNAFGQGECARIGRVTRHIEMVGLSLSSVSLMISLYIFFSYRILKNNRTKIHKNLFFATLFQVFFRLIKYIDQELDEGKKFLLDDYHLYEACTVLMEYAKTAMFMWMFIEGLYLHNVITVTVFQEYLHINLYIWCGWLFPAVMTIIWLTVMIVKEVKTTWAYYYFLPYYWILEGPRSTLIMINLLFLLNIIRVLVVKLRQTRSSEIEQVRKAVRAAIFLLPLMGTAHILFLLDYRFNEAWKFGFWSYTTYFLNSFQGFFVAVLYCFLNGEVQTAIRNSYFLHASLRRNNYTPCRGFTVASSIGGDGDINSSGRSSWMKCCSQAPQSPEEKEIDLCDIHERRDGPTTITMIETIPMISRHADSNGIDRRGSTKEQSDAALVNANHRVT